jgi:small subunit ribosomal protein S6
MAFFESVFIARQDISASAVDALADGYQKLFEDNGGKVTKREYWGLRNLAYKIKKNRKGHYVLFNIDAPAAAVAEFERNMKISDDVLRFLTIRLDELDPEPSIVMQFKGRDRDRDRGDRGFRGGRRFEGRGGRDDDGPRGGRRGGGDESKEAKDTKDAKEGDKE